MENQTKKNLSQRLQKLKAELGDTQLVAVTKQTDLDQIEQCYLLGQRDFGENRVEQLLERSDFFYKKGLHDIRWHFIGHLQSNKLKKLFEVHSLYAIHSIDSLKLAKKIAQFDQKSFQHLKLFLQVKTSFEEEKFGLQGLDEIKEALVIFKQTRFLKLAGLMTMAPIRTQDIEASAIKSFSQLKEFQEALYEDDAFKAELSMGMSGDYRYALRLGSHWVRLGRTLFSESI